MVGGGTDRRKRKASNGEILLTPFVDDADDIAGCISTVVEAEEGVCARVEAMGAPDDMGRPGDAITDSDAGVEADKGTRVDNGWTEAAAFALASCSRNIAISWSFWAICA